MQVKILDNNRGGYYHSNQTQSENMQCLGHGTCLQRSKKGPYDFMSVRDCKYKCKPLECPNFQVCGRKFPAWMGSSGDKHCIDCFVLLHNTKLPTTFQVSPTDEQCIICMDTTGEEVTFPWCNHKFCCKCTGEILFHDETKFETSPFKFGCPACPVGCKNPNIGKQCRCPEYLPVVQTWMENNPDDWKDWISFEVSTTKICKNRIEQNGDSRGSGRCPVCRRGAS